MKIYAEWILYGKFYNDFLTDGKIILEPHSIQIVKSKL